MKLILQENVKDLGHIGDVVTVKDGYARNYLLPKGLALLANTKHVKELEHYKKMAAGKFAKAKKTVEDLSAKLSALALTIEKEAGEEDKLFGSVTSRDIAEVLATQGYTIDRHDIKLAEPIKALGDYEVELKLPMQVAGKLKVKVVKK